MLDTRTVRAMDVFGLGREIPGGVQGDEPGVAHGPHGLEQTDLIEGLVQLIKETKQMPGRDRVERVASVTNG